MGIDGKRQHTVIKAAKKHKKWKAKREKKFKEEMETYLRQRADWEFTTMKDAFHRGYGIFRDTTTWEDILSCNADFHIEHIIKEHMGAEKAIADNTPRKQRPTPRAKPKPAKKATKPKGHQKPTDLPTYALTPSSTPTPSRYPRDNHERTIEDSPSEQAVSRISKRRRIPTDKPQDFPNQDALASTGQHPIVLLPAPANKLTYTQYHRDRPTKDNQAECHNTLPEPKLHKRPRKDKGKSRMVEKEIEEGTLDIQEQEEWNGFEDEP